MPATPRARHSWSRSRSRSEPFRWSWSGRDARRVFLPLPPARSGIADYSEALIERLKTHVDLEVFSGGHQPYDPARFDIAVYHVGNNGYHGFVYETALRHPG